MSQSLDALSQQRAAHHACERSAHYCSAHGTPVAARHRADAQGQPRYHSCHPQKKAQPVTLIQQIAAPLYGDSLEIDDLVVRFRRKRRYRYLWIVVSRLSRHVLAYFLGDRSRKSLRQLWQRVPPAYRRKLVYTDEYHVYTEVLRPWHHRPSPKGSGRTSVIEGLNNKWRNRVAGLVRKTVCVQSLADLEDRLRLVFNQHNQQCSQRLRALGFNRASTH